MARHALSHVRMTAQSLAVALCGAVLVVISSGGVAVGAERSGDGRQVLAETAELPELRTRTSRTFTADDGRRRARIYPFSVNFSSDGREWRPIDNTLVPSARAGFAYENKANRYRLGVPGDLNAPLRFEVDGAWVELRLEGAGGSPAVARDTAKFRDALRDVDVAYQAGPDGLKETITLKRPTAPRTFGYTLTASEGLSARAGDGRIEVVDSAGRVVFDLTAPLMWDSSGQASGVSDDVELRLTGRSGGYRVELAPDGRWLESSRREWPVYVDPSVEYRGESARLSGANADCTITGGLASDTSACANPTLGVGFDGTAPSRALLRYDVEAAIPFNSHVYSALWGTHLASRTGTDTIPVGLRPLTESFDSAASWNKRDATNAWATPGGSLAAAAAPDAQIAGAGAWYYWQTRELVQRWVSGVEPNRGVALVGRESGTANLLTFASSEGSSAYWPHLDVWYDARVGTRPGYTMEGQTLSNGQRAEVNVGNGNLFVSGRDIDLSATTAFDVDVDRYYNSHWRGGRGTFGKGWVGSIGMDVRIRRPSDDVRVVHAPGLDPLVFTRNPDGSWKSPPGIDVALTRQPNGSYTATFRESGHHYEFPASESLLAAIVDSGGRRMTFTYKPDGAIATATDPTGAVTRFDTNADRHVTKVTAPGNTTTEYTYDPNGYLLTARDTAGRTTTYEYQGSNYDQRRLAAVVAPDGQRTTFTYDSFAHHRRTTAVTVGTSATTFAYVPGRTTVTRPGGFRTEYAFDSDLLPIWPDEPDPVAPTVDYSACQARFPASYCDDAGDPPPAGTPIESGDTDEDPGGGSAGGQSLQAAAAAPLEFGLGQDAYPPLLTSSGVEYGLFDTYLFKSLEIRRVRRIVEWDLLDEDATGQKRFPEKIAEFERWFSGAANSRLEVMISFRADPVTDTNRRPPKQKYADLTAKFLSTYGRRVKYVSAWNEPNIGHQPTRASYGGPKLAAAYTNILQRDVCKLRAAQTTTPTCRVVAGEPAEVGAWQDYLEKYVAELRRLNGSSVPLPDAWGHHPYRDVSDLGTTRSRTFARLVPGPVWFTEVGGHVRAQFGNAAPGESGQATQVRFLVDQLAKHPDVQARRLYYYPFWEPQGGPLRTDTGLLQNGQPNPPLTGGTANMRPAYKAYRYRSRRP